MKSNELKQEIIQTLSRNGYTHIKVYPNLFCTKADVYARNKRNKKEAFVVKTVYKKGKTSLQFKGKGNLDWIDELEMLDAIFDD